MKKSTIVKYVSFLMALLVGELVMGNLQPLYSVRILYPILLISFIFGKFAIVRNSLFFYFAIFLYLINALFHLNNPIIVAECINIGWWLTFSFILNAFINTEKDFILFRLYLFRTSFVLTFIGALIGLYKFYLLVQGVVWSKLELVGESGYTHVIAGTSLSGDYNVYSFGVIFGIISGWYLYSTEKREKYRLLIAVALLIMDASAMLSGSRRGLVVGVIIAILFIGFSFKDSLSNFNNNRKRFPWLQILTVVCFLYFTTKISFEQLAYNSLETQQVFDRLSTVSEINSEENDNRTPRWEFSFELFENYDVWAKLFGDGFDYSHLIGHAFNETGYDYPHNVFVSSLLYSGIVGALVLCISSYQVFRQYYINRKTIGVIGIWFLLLFFLNLTSSNSIFSFRIGIILYLLPNFNFFKKVKYV